VEDEVAGDFVAEEFGGYGAAVEEDGGRRSVSWASVEMTWTA